MNRPTFLLVAHGFRYDRILLQPWRYLYELFRRCAAGGEEVVVITDPGGKRGGEWEEKGPEGIRVIGTRDLAPWRWRALERRILEWAPHRVYWSVTPRSVVYEPLFRRLPFPVVAVLTAPLYPWRSLLRALGAGVSPWEMRSLLEQRLVPRRWFARLLRLPSIVRVVVQSRANGAVLRASGVAPETIARVPVGLDKERANPASPEAIFRMRQENDLPARGVVFLYLGGLRSIRGIDLLMRAFAGIDRCTTDPHLVILARDADPEECARLAKHAARLGVEHRVHIRGGRLDPQEVRNFLDLSDAVVLPFVLAPSDVPIAVLEAMERGKPVISSPVDGIPELLRGRGLLVDPVRPFALSRALTEVSRSPDLRRKLGRAARSFMGRYPDWDAVFRIAVGEGIF